ncbi:uncharacterized protein LOC108052316 [Drosophila rhopaloa]|uniref:Uncharacterized protein LOC108052316 n=1 Tax=Drosophila rhopaloa TaxID=1041015 RepID=A0A6P4FYD6_DRORH|nr:uncharacterized protein LOC108052316 [Drosophila rhopaloa]
MCAVYSSDDVAAYEEVDDSQSGPFSKIISEQGDKSEMQSIILLAHQEHEAQTHQQVMTAMKQREEKEFSKLRDINPLPQSFVQNRDAFDEDVRFLLSQIASEEDRSGEDEDYSF